MQVDNLQCVKIIHSTLTISYLIWTSFGFFLAIYITTADRSLTGIGVQMT